ncbi:MAG: DUF2934 domain-containing protein [Opitutaceae bacterium]
MNTNSPTHESVSQRAQQIWRERGCPSGCDTEIWLEAERALATTASAQNAPSSTEGRGDGNSQAGPGPADPKVAAPTHERPSDVASVNPPHPTPAEAAALATQQKKAARAPKQPGKIAPKAKPPESGKPVWDKPHSS